MAATCLRRSRHAHAQVVKSSLMNPDLGLEPLLELDLAGGAGPTAQLASQLELDLAGGAGPTAQLASQLEPELSDLGALLDDRHHESSRATDVRLRRQRVIREFDREIRTIVRMAQGMFRLAGRDDLAERFRPALRRIVRRIKKAEAREAATQAADADATEGTRDASSSA